MSDQQLVELKDRAAARLMTLPGVTGVGLGGRMRAGQPTGEIVLKVFVERKRPLADLAPAEVLPGSVEGLGVDVGELSAPRLQTIADPDPPLLFASPPTTQADADERRYRPLLGGVNILPDLPGAWFGTMGCLLRHATDPAKVYGLTNFHLFAPAGGAAPSNTTRVGQPNAESSPTKCCSNLIGTFAAGAADNLRDAALIQLDPGAEWLAEIVDIGPVAGTHTVTVAEAATLGYQVRKRGARTGLTGGTVESINTTATANGITRNDLMVITPNPIPFVGPVFFSDAGDSGSAVVNNDGEVVALHFAGSAAGDVHKGFAVPIDVVIARFQAVEGLPVTVATASTFGQVNVVPGARPLAAPAELPAPVGGLPDHPELLGRVAADLDRSAAGRRLVALWLEHHAELLALVNENRRVTIAWHRGGGPALLQTLVRTAADPALPVPATINGEPPSRRLARLHAALHAAASPELRQALDRVRADLPDPAGLTYPQMLAALAAR